jgi:large subunit ribosomal protein L17
MRHKKLKHKVGKKSGHDLSLRRNLAASLFINGKISTTEKRSKIVIPFAEKLITISKQKNLHSKRRINSLLNHQEAEKKLINEISKNYIDKKGGYIKNYKINPRKGDNAKMVRIELI